MTTKRLPLLVLFLCCVLVNQKTFSQAPAIEWENTIGGDGKDILASAIYTSDGGYIVAGWSESSASGDKSEKSKRPDYWIVKYNAAGATDWQRTLGGKKDDYLARLIETSDGGFLVCGNSNSDISEDKTENSIDGSDDFWMVKLDETGAIEWQNTIGGNAADKPYALQQTNDGGYIVGGESRSAISGDKSEDKAGTDYWVLKLNSTGSIEWQNTIGGSGTEILNDLQQTSDGGYILGGHSDSGISGDKTEANIGSRDYWVVKLNGSGAIEWQNTIGGSSYDDLYAVQQTSDGGYILGGYSASGISGDKSEALKGQTDYWVIKLNGTGNIEWQHTIGGNNFDRLYDILQTADGRYILAGESSSNASGDKSENSNGFDDYWIVMLNHTGDIAWEKSYGGSNDDIPKSIQQTPDGGFFIGGFSVSGISADKSENSQGSLDYWVVKLFADQCNGITVYADADGDYYGDASAPLFVADCTVPSGYVTDHTDCNDAAATVHPGMLEILNAVDDDCNGITDDIICNAPGSLEEKNITATSVKLTWAPVSLATGYKLRYQVVGSASWTVIHPNGKAKILENLAPNTSYYWKIKTICGSNPQITSDWSNVEYFKTALLKMKEEDAPVFLDIFPNPAAEITTIQFHLPQSSQVSVKIFDVNGKEMQTLMKDIVDEGDHSISVNTAALSKGIYLVQMISGNRIQNQKLIVQ